MKGVLSTLLIASLGSVSAQGVTAIISAPGTAPSGCAATQNGVFGIQVVQAAAGSSMKKRQVSQIADGQIQATSAGPATPVTAIADGQIQAPSAGAARPVTAIADGQIQAPTGAAPVTVTVTKDNCLATPVTQIGDGQIQVPPQATPVTAIADGQIQAPVSGATPVTAIGDGQIQAPVSGATPVTAIGDGQIQAPTAEATPATPVTAIGDGQVQAPTATPVTAIGDGQAQAGTTLATSTRSAGMSVGTTAAGFAMLAGAAQACASTTGVLKLSLSEGVLKDGQGRIGYIAENSQFQFDGPPQTGAKFTAGFSVCNSGLLALGNSTVFYQCLSGDFYNLYQENILSAGQCEPVNIEVIQLNNC